MDTSKTQKQLRFGWYIPPKKIEKMNLNSFFELLKLHPEIEVVNLDIKKSIEEQSGGKPFDVVLLKVLGEIISSKEKPEVAKELQDWENYFQKHKNIVQIDPISSQRLTLDRHQMGIIFSQMENEAPKELKIRNPKHLLIESHSQNVDTSSITFPVICKLVEAGGSSAAHRMALVFDQKGFSEMPVPFIAQEYLNHNATIYKVFVVGRNHYVVKRRSLPNIPSKHETTFFDSQKPFEPQMKALIPEGYVDPFESTPQEPPAEVLQWLTKSLSQSFNMQLFGYDVIVEQHHGTYGVIDINYFPGYRGVDDLDGKLLHLITHAHEL
mmetsp:Transcript_15784/g.21988  ORF Transcript_15784/g.21988 Transcript_15784/m.21988 type:complete len:324 (-) Transcript_15784:39-1010(-)